MNIQKFPLNSLFMKNFWGDNELYFGTDADPCVGLSIFPFFNVRQYYCHVIDIGWTSVRPSVRLSHGVLCRNGSTCRKTVFTAW